MVKILSVLIICTSFLFGCIHSSSVSNTPLQSSQKSNLTPGMVQTKIVKCVTTKNEILGIFGPPNIITKNKSGKEVWTYERQSVTSTSRGSATEAYGTIGIAGVGGSRTGSSQETSTSTFTLMITFAEDDIVENYSMMSTIF